MMLSRAWHTSAVVNWLQNVLEERFGHVFQVEPRPDSSSVAMGLPGDPRHIILATNGAMFVRADSDLPCASWDAGAEGWHSALPGALPAPGAACLTEPLITATADGWHVGYDILGLTYWMLTRQEEVGRTDLDGHGRFPGTASHAYKHGYLERPIVDEWLHVLGQIIAKTWPTLPLVRHKFSIKVSHDVDAPSRYGFAGVRGLLRVMGGDVLKRGDLKAALKAPWIRLKTGSSLHPDDPFNTFEWIMDVSDRYGMTSAFYFICGRTSEMDADYEPEHPAIRTLMRRIHERGHEIGLHPSYNTYQCADALVSEATRLRQIATEEGITQSEWGGRMHYLRWAQPTTLRAWDQAGMDYDSTLSYADRPGFRCGTCFEYPAFDPVTGQALTLRIRPLVVMECSVMDACYLGLGSSEAAAMKFKQLKDACCAVDGCYTVLWHNSRLVNKIDKEQYAAIFE